MSYDLNNSFQAKLEALRKRKAQAAKALPPPPQAEPEPELIYYILNFVLTKGKASYLIPLRATHLTTQTHKATHLARLCECGTPMQVTRHIFELWDIPPNAQTVGEMTNTPPRLSIFTKPFLFHHKASAEAEARRIIHLQLETAD